MEECYICGHTKSRNHHSNTGGNQLRLPHQILHITRFGNTVKFPFYWNTNPSIPLYTVHSCFHATRTDSSSCKRNRMACKAYNIYIWPLTEKQSADPSFQHSGEEDEQLYKAAADLTCRSSEKAEEQMSPMQDH